MDSKQSQNKINIEFKNILIDINTLMNIDESDFKQFYENRGFSDFGYLENFVDELNGSFLKNVNKNDTLKYYLFELSFWNREFVINNNELIFNKQFDGTDLSFREKSILDAHYIFEIIIDEIILCCSKYEIDFYKICDELNFDYSCLDTGMIEVFTKQKSKHQQNELIKTQQFIKETPTDFFIRCIQGKTTDLEKKEFISNVIDVNILKTDWQKFYQKYASEIVVDKWFNVQNNSEINEDEVKIFEIMLTQQTKYKPKSAKIAEKWHALHYYFELMAHGKSRPIDIDGCFKKSELEQIGKDRSGLGGRGFYNAFKEIDITDTYKLKKIFSDEWKSVILEKAKNDMITVDYINEKYK